MFISSISEVTGDAVTWHDAEEAGKTVKNIVHKDYMKGHLESSVHLESHNPHREMSQELLTS